MKERRIWLLTWREFSEALRDTDLAILPVGVIEAHGPHLPLGTDFLISEWISEQLAEELNALIAPPVSYGVVSGLSGYWGSITLRRETLQSIMYDVLTELANNGFEKVVIINGHGGSGHVQAISNAMKEAWSSVGLKSVLINWWEFSSNVTSDMFKGSGGHAGVDEAAMIMAMDPGLVKGEPEEEEIYKIRRGILPVPLPGSVLAYQDDFVGRLPTPQESEEFARRILERIKIEVERIIEGWDRQDISPDISL